MTNNRIKTSAFLDELQKLAEASMIRPAVKFVQRRVDDQTTPFSAYDNTSNQVATEALNSQNGQQTF